MVCLFNLEKWGTHQLIVMPTSNAVAQNQKWEWPVQKYSPFATINFMQLFNEQPNYNYAIIFLIYKKFRKYFLLIIMSVKLIYYQIKSG